MSNSDRAAPPRTHWYAVVWRWHFYAGLFCVPFVIWLSLTGLTYLWRPQIEAALESRYDHLSGAGPRASADAVVAAAVAAVPGSTLQKYVLPQTEFSATRVLVARADKNSDKNSGETSTEIWRVYVDPWRAVVLGQEAEEGRLMRLVFRLHGELMIGALGSFLVETAACWAVVLILTGLYLWWPRGIKRAAGVLYPRLGAGMKLALRDLHAVTGLYVSVLALGLIFTGLPWAKAWGTYFNEIRVLTGTARPIDWTIGGKMTGARMGEHAGHGAHRHAPVFAPGEVDRVATVVARLRLAAPVTLAPPTKSAGVWSVASDAADRPLRGSLTVDGATGRVLSRTDFAQRHIIDRVVGYGIAIHEGALFGLANQILGSFVALSLVLLCVSATLMWWRRRPEGRLGAPASRGTYRLAPLLVAGICVLAISMPMFGLSLALAVLLEALLLRRWKPAALWLGLRAVAT